MTDISGYLLIKITTCSLLSIVGNFILLKSHGSNSRFIGVTFISRSAVDFASALDVIWPFFAGLLKDIYMLKVILKL